MKSLNKNGRSVVIISDGMLFNRSKQYIKTRRYLIEKFNLTKIISLNDGFFLNTSITTPIIFFTNDDNKTTIEVEFSEIKLKNDKLEETIIVKVNLNDIKQNKYSLYVNKYVISNDEK